MGKSYAAWAAALEWTPMTYEGIETAFVREEDGDSYYLARWSRDEDHGILAWATVHGDTREEAMKVLIECAPDIMLMLHDDLQREVQKRRMVEPDDVEWRDA